MVGLGLHVPQMHRSDSLMGSYKFTAWHIYYSIEDGNNIPELSVSSGAGMSTNALVATYAVQTATQPVVGSVRIAFGQW